MKLGFSCAIDGREPYHFAQLALHIHTATLGEGWDTVGSMVLCLQNALANLTALQRATHTTPLNAITPARASLAQYYDTPHAVLPYGTSTFDGECLCCSSINIAPTMCTSIATPPFAKHTRSQRL